MESCCRACSRSDDFRRFSLYAVAEVSQEVIANMIRDTSDTQVSTEDGLPQQICPDCLMTLSLAYSFRKQCRRSDAKFREYWGGRTPSQSVDQQQHQQQQQPHQQSQQHQLPRRSQSHVPDEGSFEAVATTIKEEVDIYDYEYSVPSGGHDNQWVIQNPRTIGEGAMTVVHNTGGQYYDEAAAAAAIAAGETGGSADRDGHSMIHPMDDPSEMGESSGLGQKNDDKLKKNVPNAERYSQRIRRQEISSSLPEKAPRSSETADWGRFSVSVIPEASLLASTSTPTNLAQQQRCQHCMKKMKKPYKHRNGKCLEPKYRASNRPKCAYCHQTFSSSKGIPSHLRNSCRVYRQVCEAKGISLPPADHSSSPYDTSSAPSETPEPPASSNPKPLPVLKPTNSEQKLKRPRTGNWTHTIVCQYCNKKFLKKSALNRHVQRQCLVWVRKQTENIASVNSTKEVTTGVPVPLPAPSSSFVPDDKSAIVKKGQQQQQLQQKHEQAEEQRPPPAVVVEELTKCVYCQQSVGKKTRFQHHNGRCVLGRVNAEHPCPHCPEAFMTRNLLLKHRCDPAQKFENPQTQLASTDGTAKPNALPPDRKQRRLAKLTPKQLALVKAKSPVKQVTPRKQSQIIPLETPTSIVKREFCSHCRQRIKDSDRQRHEEKRCFNKNEVTYNCGYCRKGFAARDSLIEHQRVCTVRKQHKQVKCTFCGQMISNRGNLKKHQKVYCKSIKRADGEEISEKPEKLEKPDKPKKVEKLGKPDKPVKSPKSYKPRKLAKPIKSEKPLKLKKVKSEEPVKIKPKIKKDKSNHSKSPDDEMENIPLKQRKLHKPKPTTTAQVSAAEVETTKKVAKKKPMGDKKLRFTCEYCKRRFETDSKLRKHGHTCTVKRANLTLVCPHCATPFSKKGNLERHLRLKCKSIDRDKDKSVLNSTISELLRSEATDTPNSTLEHDEDEGEESQEPVVALRATEAEPSDSPRQPSSTKTQNEPERSSPAPVKVAEISRTEEEPEEDDESPEHTPPSSPAPVKAAEVSRTEELPMEAVESPEHSSPVPEVSRADTQPMQPVESPAHPSPTPSEHEEDSDDDVPDPVEEELVPPEDHTTEDEMMDEIEEEVEVATVDPNDMVDPEDHYEEEDHVVGSTESPSGDHSEPDNNNAEREKAPSPEVRLPKSTDSEPPTTTLERHETSERTIQERSEPDPVDPMQVDDDHSAAN
nr:zinc finger protein Xfin-like isoform X1 [Aedes albopictus]